MPTQKYLEHSFYFFVLFADGDLRVPIIRTLRYLGTTHRRNGTEALLFEDVDPDAKGQKVIFDPEEAKEVVLDGANLLARLGSCFEGTLATLPPIDPKKNSE
jgi:hypothetical protein